jgi:hypothetical protein
MYPHPDLDSPKPLSGFNEYGSPTQGEAQQLTPSVASLIRIKICMGFAVFSSRVVDPYSFFTDPDPELDVGGQYGSGSKSGSGSNTDPGF